MPHFGNGSVSYSRQALCHGRLNSSSLGGTELGSSPTVWFQGRPLSVHIRRWHSYLSDTEDIAEVIHARPIPLSRHLVSVGSLTLSFWLSSLNTLYSELFWIVFFFTTLVIGILELILFGEYSLKLNLLIWLAGHHRSAVILKLTIESFSIFWKLRMQNFIATIQVTIYRCPNQRLSYFTWFYFPLLLPFPWEYAVLGHLYVLRYRRTSYNAE